MKKNCKCGMNAIDGIDLCHACRDAAVRMNMQPRRWSKLNRCDDDSDTPLSNTVLRSCGAGCNWRGGEA